MVDSNLLIVAVVIAALLAGILAWLLIRRHLVHGVHSHRRKP